MDLSSLPPIIFFSLPPLLLISLFLYHHNPTNKLSTYNQLKSLIQVIKNRHRFLDWSTDRLNQDPTHTIIIKLPLLVNTIITANPVNVEHMLKSNFDNYPKGNLSISLLEDLLGHGIFNSDGDHWKQQRKAASHEFSKRSLRNFAMEVVHREFVQGLLPLLAKSAANNEIIDLQDVFERFAFDNICRLTLGEDAVPSDFMEAFGDAQNLIMNRFMDSTSITWRIKKLLNVGSEKLLKRSVSIIHDFTRKMVKLRKYNPSDQSGSDLLSRFAIDKDKTEGYLHDIVISFIIAGRETTSSALTWFFWLLSSRPDVVERILEEIRSIRKLNQNFSGPFSFDELREMNYLHAAISEAMRLYPPVPIDTHSCLKDDFMPDGTFVGKGWFVSYCSYAMGRMEDIWGEDCRDYKPERWLDNGIFKPENPFRYTVFHAGPRMCLGKEMAYIQMKSIAASMIEMFDIDVMMDKEKAPEQPLVPNLKMKGGLPVMVRKRDTV